MNKDFAEWYRTVSIEPNSAHLENRWKGIEEFIEEDCSASEIFELVRLFYNVPASREFREKFADYFSNADSAFPRKNLLELAVLAGAALIEIIGQKSQLSNLTMLAAISMNFNNRILIIPDIYQLILQQFNIKTASIRENIKELIEDSPIIPPSKSILSKIGGQNVVWNEEIGTGLHSYITSLNRFLTEVVEINNNNLEYISICSEDSRVLWWMVGEWSNDFNTPFKSISPISVAIVTGKELADVITILPGPHASRAVLYKVLNPLKKPKAGQQNDFSNIIDDLDIAWKQTTIKSYPVDDTKDITPVLTAISKSIEVDGAKEWIPGFNKATGLELGKIKISADELAYQVYMECLTIKCFSNIEV